MASDIRLPVLGRAKFLAIFSSNLDEFFQIRVAGLKAQIDSGLEGLSIDGLSAGDQLDRIHEIVLGQYESAYSIYSKSVIPELQEEDIRIVGLDELTQSQRLDLRRHFEREIFPDGMDQAWRDAAGMVAVPEPTTALLLGLGLVGLSMKRRMAS